MLTYEPDARPAHALDPRSKLLFQAGFALAVFTAGSWPAFAALALTAGATLAAAGLSPVRVLRTFRFVLALLAVAVLFGAVQFGPPWVDPDGAVESMVAGFRVVLVLFVSSAYVRSTPVRETRAAIQRHVPGRPGRLLGVGMSLVVRFFPVLQVDLRNARLAIRARGGDRLSAIERVRRLTVVGLRRALTRADRLSVALRARCFAWNPTLPRLRFSRWDLPVLVLAVGLSVSPLFL